MKPHDQMKEVEAQIAHALRAQLQRIPSLKIQSFELESQFPSSAGGALWRPDILAQAKIQDRKVHLVCEVKMPGYPRQIREAITQLQAYRTRSKSEQILMVGASWLSPESRALCEERGVGWLDLAGNCRIAFDGIYIERETANRPKAATRNFRAIFAPKASRVLRTLLQNPSRVWKVTDLAEASGVSLGHVSNVGSALREREWAVVEDGGLRLNQPDALLDTWRDEYEPVRGERSFWYTILHGRQMEDALRKALSGDGTTGLAMLGGLSAAHWLAPYFRGSMTTIYADKSALPRLVDILKLKPAKSGANVEIIEPEDLTILNERADIPSAPPVSSPILTYLELSRFDDRGREAADYLREKLLKWR